MDYMEEAALRLKRKNQILFSREGLWELDLLLRQQNRRTVVCWAFEMAAGLWLGVDGACAGGNDGSGVW